MSQEALVDFLCSATVVDTETTGKEPETCEICELATGRIEDGWKSSSKLFKTKEPIPPEASSKSLISNRMVENEPLFGDVDWMDLADMLHCDNTEWYVAHNSEFDRLVLQNNLKARGERNKMFEDGSRWLCTWRLAKAVFGVDFDSMQYSLQYLRFYLDLDVPDDIPAHRADADVITTGKLLEYLVFAAVETGQLDTNHNIGEQLHSLCWSPVRVKTWPLGKHKGKALEEVPTDYYKWALQNVDRLQEGSAEYDMDLAASVAEVLTERLEK
jgi:DNA polymerase III epsilon subunit-like protein